MNHITLAWMENDERVTRTLEVGDETIQAGVFRIGRDPDQCDVVMPSATERDRTVSRCHVEISFDADRFGFYLTNLRANNPPYIKGQPVTDSVKLTQGCTFELGEVELTVERISAVPETIIIQRPRNVPPQEQATVLLDRSASQSVDFSPAPQSASQPAIPVDSDATIYPDETAEPSAQNQPSIPQPQSPNPQSPQPQAPPVVVPPAPQNIVPSPAVPPAPTDPAPTPAPTPVPDQPEASTPPVSPVGSVFDRVKDQLFSCPNGHKYTLAEAKELGWICKYDGYLITSTFVAK
ncbi:MAG: FHA domain-containing protein [Cyanobacteria bacterium P01_E01_bin.45]